MKITKLLFIAISIFAAFALLAGCTTTKTSAPKESMTVRTNANTGTTEIAVNDPEKVLESFDAFEEAAAKKMEFFSADDLKQLKVTCMVVKKWSAYPYFDRDGEFWNGIAYDGAIVPVVAQEGEFTTADGRKVYLVKAIARVDSNPMSKGRNPREKEFVALYWAKDDLTGDWKESDLGKQEGAYDVTSDMPDICTLDKVKPLMIATK